jgi:hypothetical protein
MGKFVVVLVVASFACTKSSPHPPPPPAPVEHAPVAPPAPNDAVESVDAAEPIDAALVDAALIVDAPPSDAASAPSDKHDSKPKPKPKPKPNPAGTLTYISDCSLTHPIARDVCSGTAPLTNGLKSCEQLAVKRGDACTAGAPRCWVPRTCDDGRVLPSDYLECTDKQSGRCFTRSSRQFKRDIEYLDADELADLAAQVQALRVARYRYKDSDESHLGFITEDARGAAFVTPDGRRVDLYALLSASIVALQAQDARIKALEARCQGETQ